MLADYVSYSLKNMKSRKLRSWLTMIGIFIGIASVVSLVGLGEGLKTAIDSQFSVFGTDLIRMSPSGAMNGPPSATLKPFHSADVRAIASLKEINQAMGRLTDYSTVQYNNKLTFGIIGSMPDGVGRTLMDNALDYKTSSGRLLKDGDTGSIVIGANIADKETFGKAIIVGSKITINKKSFKVIGIVEKKGSFITDNVILMNEQDQRKTFDRPSDAYDMIIAQVNKGYSLESAQSEAERVLRKQRNVRKGEEDFVVTNPQEVLKQVNSTLFAVNLFVYIIAGISVLVGGIGIMTTMYTAVVERTREIGIMKAIGARNSTIFTLFFIESGFMGMAGGIIGTLLGMGIAYSLAELGRKLLGAGLIQATISPFVIIAAILSSFILGALFGTMPALKASKMNPVDAMRYVK